MSTYSASQSRLKMRHISLCFVCSIFCFMAVSYSEDENQVKSEDLYFQAHRGGLLEVPENTLLAYKYAWDIPGAIPEIDVQTSKDGIFVCIHDDTMARTTDAPKEVRDKNIPELNSDEIRRWDAGGKFDPQYVGQRVPLLSEVFEEMKGHPERQAYLDLKGVDLAQLGTMISEYGLAGQVIFVHGDPAMCLQLTERFPGARTMTWLSGTPDAIKKKFEELAKSGFKGISELQFHLRDRKENGQIRYVLDDDFLRQALAQLRAAGSDLMVRPFDFDARSLKHLLDLGIKWYVADEPKRFHDTLQATAELKGAKDAR